MRQYIFSWKSNDVKTLASRLEDQLVSVVGRAAIRIEGVCGTGNDVAIDVVIIEDQCLACV